MRSLRWIEHVQLVLEPPLFVINGRDAVGHHQGKEIALGHLEELGRAAK